MTFPGLIGQKHGMTQVFDDEGFAIPVTVLELLPLVVTQVKTKEKDGYTAVQVGYKDAKAKHLTRPEQKHLEKNGIALKRHLQEFRVSEAEIANYNVGDAIDPVGEGSFLLNEGQKVSATGKSIGKGFQGDIKRWNHSRGPMSHGSKSHRIPGSIGAGTTPGRVYKGKQMPNMMGNAKVTTTNLKVVRVIPEKNVVLVRGAVPGCDGNLLTIRAKRDKWNS